MTAKRKEPAAETHKWEFKARSRRHAFGWKSQPAITRIKQAVAEIKKVAKKDPVLAAEGAIAFLERVSPALEHVDSSSGSIGTAVDNAIAEPVPIIADAPVDTKTREAWLEWLYEAHQDDQIPYIERLADDWGDLCASSEVASAWADRLIGITRMALSSDPNLRGHFHGTFMCLSALFRAGRYEKIVDLVSGDRIIWNYKEWAVKALAAQGKKAEALRYAEGCRNPWASDLAIDRLCEEILLSSGMVEEAYTRYGLRTNQAGTYLATFRTVVKKYPHKPAGEVLSDLVKTTPGDEGKWFAAAKDADLYHDALALASRTPCDPKTLARAARDFGDKEPAFAIGAGLLSLHWLVQGYGYEITGADVWDAYRATIAAAERRGAGAEVKERIRKLLATEQAGGFVTRCSAGSSGCDTCSRPASIPHAESRTITTGVCCPISERIAVHVVRGAKVLERRDLPVDLREPPRFGGELQPRFDERVPALALEVDVLTVPHEEEGQRAMRVIPRRRSAHADLAQPTERAALDGLTVVLLLEPFLQFLTREVKSSGNANRTRLRASASAKLRASASVPQPGVRSQPATTGFSSVITRSRSATSLRSATGGTNP